MDSFNSRKVFSASRTCVVFQWIHISLKEKDGEKDVESNRKQIIGTKLLRTARRREEIIRDRDQMITDNNHQCRNPNLEFKFNVNYLHQDNYNFTKRF